MKSSIKKTHCGIGATLALFLMLLGAYTAGATYPAGYYNSLNGKKGVELMKAVKNVARQHTAISYGTKTWEAFRSTDVRTIDGVDYWWDMYSNELVTVSSGHGGLNIEHSVANSWWGKTQNDAYKDICHLNPSNANANSRKSNYPLCELQSIKWDNGVTFVGTPKTGQGGGSANGYEPADEYKGDFARAFMYMFTIYDDISWKSNTDWMYDTSNELMFRAWAQELLLRWSATDPVSDKERYRNDGIYKEQKNRNPFIDLPDLADHIWGDKKDIPYQTGDPDPGPGPDPDPDPDNTLTYSWFPPTATTIDPTWTIENTDLPSGLTYVWSWKQIDGDYYLNGSAYKNGPFAATAYIYSPVISLEGCETAELSFSHAAKFQANLKDLCYPVIREEGDTEWTPLSVSSWPVKDTWNFSNSGDIDLSRWKGKKVQVGFKYGSTTAGADTWEIRNVKVVAKKTTALEEIESASGDSDDSFLVEVWGRSIAVPEGARIFDLNGREVSGDALQPGVYIVTKPTFSKSVKVLVK